MAFFFILSALAWICFICFADKKRIREFYPTCLLAMYLASTGDFGAHHYDLWNYPAPSGKQTFWYHLSQQLGIYPIVVYLFLQWLPKQRKMTRLTGYIFLWTVLAIFLEWLAITGGYMAYKRWWNIGLSYICDWILYFIFYWHYKWCTKFKQTENI